MNKVARILPITLVFLVVFLAIPPVFADKHQNRFITRGGAHEGAAITRVTSLADSGPGTLREALTAAKGANIIVFEVGGEIALKEDLYIRKSKTTIAGQTAPAPGITITGKSVRVRASDIAIEHISFRPGMSALPADRADGVTVGGGAREVERIRLRNISVSWSKDELASVANPTNGPVSITHSIFAEALRDAGHPKGQHSMALLVRDGPKGVDIAGNLFVSNVHRNPVLGSDVRAQVRNNWIVNPRYNAVHFYLDADKPDFQVHVANNVMTPGADTAPGTTPVSLPTPSEIQEAEAEITWEGNVLLSLSALSSLDLIDVPLAPANAPRTVEDVPAHVLRFAGAHPAWRSATDGRILREVLAGTTRVVDRPPSSVRLAPTSRAVRVPENPFELLPSGNVRAEIWLEELHVAAGGVAGIELPDSPIQ